jgi:hypothetical protein
LTDTQFHVHDVCKRPPTWRWWLKRLLVAVLTGTVGLAIHDGIVYYQTSSALWQALAELDRADPGWRLADIEAAQAAIPDGENSAVCVRDSAALLPAQWPPPDFDLAQDEFDPPARLDPDTYVRLCRELHAVQPALAEARKLVNRPKGRHRIAYQRNPWATTLNDQQQARRVRECKGRPAFAPGMSRLRCREK